MKVKFDNGRLYFNDVYVGINPNYNGLIYERLTGENRVFEEMLVLIYDKDKNISPWDIKKHIPKDMRDDIKVSCYLKAAKGYDGIEILVTDKVDLKVIK